MAAVTGFGGGIIESKIFTVFFESLMLWYLAFKLHMASAFFGRSTVTPVFP